MEVGGGGEGRGGVGGGGKREGEGSIRGWKAGHNSMLNIFFYVSEQFIFDIRKELRFNCEQ